jgi:hypothetical protein
VLGFEPVSERCVLKGWRFNNTVICVHTTDEEKDDYVKAPSTINLIWSIAEHLNMIQKL